MKQNVSAKCTRKVGGLDHPEEATASKGYLMIVGVDWTKVKAKKVGRKDIVAYLKCLAIQSLNSPDGTEWEAKAIAAWTSTMCLASEGRRCRRASSL
jgi:hypothetical protein